MVRDFSGAQLRRHRHTAGLTREQLAVRIGRSVWSVIQWEQGKRAPREDALILLAAGLGVAPADLRDQEVATDAA